MTPTRKYWIGLVVAASFGALAFSNNVTGRMAMGGVVFGGLYALIVRPRY